MAGDSLVINIDGASRGNPGPAAYGIVIRANGMPLLEIGERLPPTTNNIAEYTALLRALEVAEALQPARVHVRSDSELLVRQMTGVYKVKNPQIQELYTQAKRRVERLGDVSFEHVYREDNQDADRLCNEALDGHPTPAPNLDSLRRAGSPTPAAPPPEPPPPKAKKPRKPTSAAVTEPRVDCTILGDLHPGPDGTTFLVSQGLWFELVWPQKDAPDLETLGGHRVKFTGRATAAQGRPWLSLHVESWQKLPSEPEKLPNGALFD